MDSKIISLIGLVVIAAIVLFGLAPMKYGEKQGFEDKVVLDTSQKMGMFPYTTDPINKLDQYELEAVYTNEGDRELKQTEINRLTRRYPLDWSGLPPNSSKFQYEQAQYAEGGGPVYSTNGQQYKDIDGGNFVPPDTLAMEKEERRILQTYAPQKADSLTTYDIDDAQTLIEKIYQPKGLIPTVVRKENNVFEVVSTRSKKDKIEYEDALPDAPASNNSVRAAGEATIYVPPVATETAAGRDPFYEPTTSTRADRSDYTKWTPGLERMFAPTYPTTDWIGSTAAREGMS